MLNATEFPFKRLVFCYVNFASIEKQLKDAELSGLQKTALSRGPPFPHQSIRERMWPERRVQAAFSSGEGKCPTSTGEQRITWSPGGSQIPSINAWTTGAGGFFYSNCRDEGGRQGGDA